MLLHGAMGFPGELRKLALSLNKAKIPFIAPVYAKLGPQDLNDAVAHICEAMPEGETVNVVGYSLGGLLGLLVAQQCSVQKLVGIGAPWAGEPDSQLAKALFGAVTETLQLDLNITAPDASNVVSIYSNSDRVINPKFSRRGTEVPFDGISHWRLPRHSKVVQRVVAELS